MKSLNTLKTYVTDRMHRAWRRHCEIIQLAYQLEPGSDRVRAGEDGSAAQA